MCPSDPVVGMIANVMRVPVRQSWEVHRADALPMSPETAHASKSPTQSVCCGDEVTVAGLFD